MKPIKFCSPLVAVLAFTLTGCDQGGYSGNGDVLAQAADNANAALATAESMVYAGFAKRVDAEMLKLFQEQPEYQGFVSCIQIELALQKWTADQHEFFMNATAGTGDIEKIDEEKYSEAEMKYYFGPILMANGQCAG
ncbi:hypothetical protein [Microbulbifer taiwanensis]|uniref:Lipoprotein n=1 Tax=Microbulbifer taiwanensis TaxID=986746 RepID=A0ABW1YMN8_9GAMM|nr:hypothetical protein [Microbulbifer taiwanensis]